MAISAERGKSIFRKTEKELLRLSAGHRADAVHGFRTTTRRLQTLLEQLVPDNDRKAKKLLKMLNRIRKSAGKVRDIDAQLEALRSLKVPQEPRRKTQLMQSLIELRAKYEKRLRKLLKKQDIRDIRRRLRRAGGSVRLDSSRDPLSVARQILRTVPVVKGPADEETLHRYRLVVKRARYAAEFAPKSPESDKYLAELKRLQDALGNWHGGHADFEEFVEIAGADGKKFQPLEKWVAFILGFLEHTTIEREPGRIAVEKILRIVQ